MFKKIELPLTPDSSFSKIESINGEGVKMIKSFTPISIELELSQAHGNDESKIHQSSIHFDKTPSNQTRILNSSVIPVRRGQSETGLLAKNIRTLKRTDTQEASLLVGSKWKVAKKARVIGKMAITKKEILNKNYGIDESTTLKTETETKLRCILPNNIYLIYWQYFMRILTFYLLFPYVYRVCLLSLDKDGLYILEIFMQGCFMMDVFLNFFLAYYERDELVTDLRSIIMRYCFTFFIFDLIAGLPVNGIVLTMDFLPGNEDHRIFRLLTAFRIVRFLFRIAAYEGWKDISFFAKRSPTIIRLMKTLILLIYFIHFSACLFVLLAKIDGSSQTWIYLNNNQDLGSLDLYFYAVYWATQTIVTVGFGDVNINTNAERLMALVLMYIGSAVYSFMISNLGAVVEETDTFETSLKARINSFKTLAKETNLPGELVQKVKKFIETNHKHSARTSLNGKGFMKELPFTLRAQLLFDINSKIIENVPFLKDKDVDFILRMGPHLKPAELVPKEILYRENEYPEDVFFLTHGIIHLKGDTGVPLYVVQANEMFGDIEVLQNTSRITTAQAQIRCSLFSIEKEIFNEVLESYPQVKEELLNEAQGKKKRLLDVKKRCKIGSSLATHIIMGSRFRNRPMNVIDYANRMYETPADKFEKEISSFLEKGVGKKWKMKFVERLNQNAESENQATIENGLTSRQRGSESSSRVDILHKKSEDLGDDLKGSQFKLKIEPSDEQTAEIEHELIQNKKGELEDQYFEQAEKLGAELLTTIDTIHECNDSLKHYEDNYEKLARLIEEINKKQNKINSRIDKYKNRLEPSEKFEDIEESDQNTSNSESD